jgi:hypothetical protein
MFSLQQNWITGAQNRLCLEARGSRDGGGKEWRQRGEVAQTMYTHINKYKKYVNRQEHADFIKEKRSEQPNI